MFDRDTAKRAKSEQNGSGQVCESGVPFSYEIGLPGLDRVEVRKDSENEGRFLFVLLKGKDDVLSQRPLSQRELQSLPEAYDHLNNFFGGIRAALNLSEAFLQRGLGDVTDIADLLQGVIERHDTFREKSKIPDSSPEDPSIMLLRLIVDGLNDAAEMLLVTKALTKVQQDAIPAPQHGSDSPL